MLTRDIRDVTLTPEQAAILSLLDRVEALERNTGRGLLAFLRWLVTARRRAPANDG